MSNVSIENKNVFVTGANRGIGNAIVREALNQGAAKVYAGARNIETLNELKDQYGDRLIPIKIDVTSTEDIENAVNIANDVDILINNAGVFAPGNFTGGNLVDGLKANLDVNLWGVIHLTNAFLPALTKETNTAIVTLSSMVGLANMPMGSMYSVSKAAVHSLIQGLRGELKESNILVAGVYPGPIDTDMVKSFEMEKDTPQNVAKSILDSIANGVEDIFPDVMSKQAGELYQKSPKQAEAMFAEFA